MQAQGRWRLVMYQRPSRMNRIAERRSAALLELFDCVLSTNC